MADRFAAVLTWEVASQRGLTTIELLVIIILGILGDAERSRVPAPGYHRGPMIEAPAPLRPRQSGFTLSEFLLVLVFVAGLVLVIIVSVRGIRSETDTSNCQSELRTLKLAVKEYQAQNDVYPPDKDAVIDAGLASADQVRRWTITGGSKTVSPDYEPVDDACG